VAAAVDGEIAVFDFMGELKLAFSFMGRANIRTLSYSGERNEFYTGHEDGTVSVMDSKSGTFICNLHPYFNRCFESPFSCRQQTTLLSKTKLVGFLFKGQKHQGS
jgi:hypothetical protein